MRPVPERTGDLAAQPALMLEPLGVKVLTLVVVGRSFCWRLTPVHQEFLQQDVVFEELLSFACNMKILLLQPALACTGNAQGLKALDDQGSTLVSIIGDRSGKSL
ncbi:MAG TPA: hypothetical protein ENI68_07415 [Gammaproteobacteria bacterium]|nr:hypothetical protein [Gammaproteobacteria bacterium]